MVYILKDATGKVVAASVVENQANGWLQVPDSDEDYLGFLETQLSAQSMFRKSDIELARVLEDLISLLIDRDVIHFTDFPEAAQKRLIQRQGLRMKSKQLNLLDDDILI
ncbi:MAG TPA: hypothetical protein VGJ90_08570 [Methylophilaceae bacterium]|jgi:hypothetical protein